MQMKSEPTNIYTVDGGSLRRIASKVFSMFATSASTLVRRSKAACGDTTQPRAISASTENAAAFSLLQAEMQDITMLVILLPSSSFGRLRSCLRAAFLGAVQSLLGGLKVWFAALAFLSCITRGRKASGLHGYHSAILNLRTLVN